MLVDAAIRQALATQRIGIPVAARIFCQTPELQESLPRLAHGWLQLASRWLGEEVQGAAAASSSAEREFTLLAKTRGGRSLLVSISRSRRSAPSVEVILFGHRGIVSWEGDSWPAEDREELERISSAASLSPEHLSQPGRSRRRRARATANFQPAKLTAPIPPPPWGVLLIAGDHTHQPGYAEALAADQRCRLVGLADADDVSPERHLLNERLAHRLGIPLIPRLAEALQRQDVQIVSICAEPERRGRIIEQAARAGKHLYLDKPLAGSLADLASIRGAVRESGVAAHMFSQVHWPPAQAAHAWLESGRLGKLLALHCDLCFAKGHAGTADLSRPRRETPTPERYELPDAKRELTNVGVYHVVLMLWLTGRPVQRVTATTGNYFFAEHQARDVEDFGQMLLEFEGGLTASISAGRTGWRSHPHSGLHRLRLVGASGTAVIDAHRPRAEIWADAPPWTPPPPDPADPMAMWAPLPASSFTPRPKQDWILPYAAASSDDARHFLDRLEQGRTSDVSIDLAAAASEVLLAAYRSAATGHSVELPLSD